MIENVTLNIVVLPISDDCIQYISLYTSCFILDPQNVFVLISDSVIFLQSKGKIVLSFTLYTYICILSSVHSNGVPPIRFTIYT